MLGTVGWGPAGSGGDCGSMEGTGLVQKDSPPQLQQMLPCGGVGSPEKLETQIPVCKCEPLGPTTRELCVACSTYSLSPHCHSPTLGHDLCLV